MSVPVILGDCRASLIDSQGCFVFVAVEHLQLIGAGVSAESALEEVFGRGNGAMLRSVQLCSLCKPNNFVEISVRHQHYQLQMWFCSSARGQTLLWVHDQTERVHVQLLRRFMKDLHDYFTTVGRTRPDLTELRAVLEPASERTPSNSTEEGIRATSKELLTHIGTVLRHADRDLFAASGIEEMKASAARRKEFARRLHEEVVAPATALQWQIDPNSEAAEIARRTVTNTRRIIDDILRSPWEQRVRETIEPLAGSLRCAGIAVHLRVHLPEALAYELVSVVAAVSKELFTNIVKHGRAKDVSVDIRQLNMGQMMLTVIDHGPLTNLPAAENHLSANEPANMEESSCHGEAGYGLRYCSRLAEEYGGSFNFESIENGHIARLLLPLGAALP